MLLLFCCMKCLLIIRYSDIIQPFPGLTTPNLLVGLRYSTVPYPMELLLLLYYYYIMYYSCSDKFNLKTMQTTDSLQSYQCWALVSLRMRMAQKRIQPTVALSGHVIQPIVALSSHVIQPTAHLSGHVIQPIVTATSFGTGKCLAPLRDAA